MLDFVSHVKSAAYRKASKTGLVAGSERPPYPCADPLLSIDPNTDASTIASLADVVYASARHLLGDSGHEWRVEDYTDPDAQTDGGDLVLMSKKHIGPFNFARATISFFNRSPEDVIGVSQRGDVTARRRFSGNLLSYDCLAEPLPNTRIEHMRYWAPPPLYPRALNYLVQERFVEEEDSWYVFGCSIDYMGKVKDPHTIIANCLWAWELSSIGPHTFATYASCMNPNGWLPTVVVGWVKNEIANEIVALRRLVYGQKYNVSPSRNSLIEMGVDMDDIKKLHDVCDAAEDTTSSSSSSNDQKEPNDTKVMGEKVL